MAVYMDLVMVLNFFVDFLLLLGTNRMAGFPLAPMRCAVAASLGGVYGGMCLLRRFRFLGSVFWRIISLSVMAVYAFGFDRSAVKRCGIFLLLSMALGGIAASLGKGNLVALLLASGGVWILCRMGFGGTVGGREYVPLTLSYEGKSVSLIALRDSGNTLRDPVTGERVFLIGADAAERLTGLSPEQLRHPLETLAGRPIPGLRLVPYRAVGTAGGMLLALRLEQVRLNGKTQSAIVAFVPDGLGSGASWQALVTVE